MHPTIENEMKTELRRIAALDEKCKGKGAIIALENGYIAGLPYLMSTDANRAFRFKHKTQATSFLKKFRVKGGLRSGKVVVL